ncbi:MAG: ABC transporter permease [Bacteroidales bacterium]|nr:ABC transporter permease [Bacteroidales bacterium]
MKLFSEIGEYVLLILQAFKRPDKGFVFRRQLWTDLKQIGSDSIGIIAIISVFLGAIMAIQLAYNIDSPFIPRPIIGFATRSMLILEISPTFMSMILAGKVGSRIASEIGTMRITEQIDALRVMGVNPANYLILPKITAAMIYFPVLVTFSIFLGVFGGWVSGSVTGLVPSVDYIQGIREWFVPFNLVYAMIKTLVFAFIITSVAAYRGYTVKGGSVEVGQASTNAVVQSNILIIIFDLILTQMLLT